MSTGDTDIMVRVLGRRELADGIVEFTLSRAGGRPLPAFGTGAHIDVETPDGHRRSYSLCEVGAAAPRAYVIAVDRHDGGEGGSLSMHRAAVAGSVLQISAPSPGFAQDPSAAESVLIAGGIGITAVRGLFHELRAHDRPVRLVYLARQRERAAYLDELHGPGVDVHVSGERGRGRYDLWPLLAEPEGRQLYCCGPQSLMRAVKSLTMHWRPSNLHFEDFVGVTAQDPFGAPFTAVWEPTGQTVEVGAADSLLDRLTAAGVSVPSSCRSGTCGTCRVQLVEGTPQHRDIALTDEERRTQLITCVSRAEGMVRLAP